MTRKSTWTVCAVAMVSMGAVIQGQAQAQEQEQEPVQRASAAQTPVAASGLTVPAGAFAQSSVTIDGRIDLSVDQVHAGARATTSYGTPNASTTRMNDNTSRLAFRGVESLGGGLKAVFGLEYGFNADAGTVTTPNFRHSFVGLQGDWGTVVAGRLDSGAYGMSPAYSQIGRNVSYVVHDAGAVAIGTRILNANNRVSNAVAYKTPEWGGFSATMRVNLAGPDAPATPASPLRNENDFRQYQAAINYDNGPLRVGLADGKDDKRGGLQANDFRDKVQAVISYDFDGVRPYAVWGRDHYENTARTRGSVNYWLVGAKMVSGVHSIIANYMQRDVQTALTGAIRKFQVGYAYSLSKRSMLYAFIDRDEGNTALTDTVTRAVGLGIQHRF